MAVTRYLGLWGRLLCALALTPLCTMVSIMTSTTQALESLDDSALSTVTGQAQGIRFTSEFDTSINAITYTDDDGYYRGDGNSRTDGNGRGDGNASQSAGTIRLSPIRIATPTNRPIVIDLSVATNDAGETGLVLVNKDMAIDLDIGKIEINGVSIGAYGQNNFKIGAENGGLTSDEFRVELYGGGAAVASGPGDDVGGDSGMTFNISLPNSLAFDTYFEDPDGNGNNPGARLTSTVSFQSNSGKSGLELNNITLDIVDNGLRIGLPETNGGDINVYNARLGDAILNSVAYRNIDIKPGSYVLLKNARGQDDSAIEFDAVLSKRSAVDYVYIDGEVDVASGVVSDPDIYEGSASFVLLDDLSVSGARVNVDRERGLVVDFDPSQADAGVSAHVLVNDVKFRRSDRDIASTPTLGTFDAQINLTNNSYLQVEGH